MIAGLTAWHGLVDVGGLKQGTAKRVLINGGSGGVGHYAIAIAKAHGAYVVTTCSGESASLVKSAGADEFVDYKSVKVTAHLKEHYSVAQGKGFDFIFDVVGNSELFNHSEDYLVRDGIYCDIAVDPHPTLTKVPFIILGVLEKLFRPKLLGGVARKYKIISLPAATMVRPSFFPAVVLELY